METISTNSSVNTKLPNNFILEPRLTAALQSKIDAIYKHEEIIWKIRAGYLAILYAGLTFLGAQTGVLAALKEPRTHNHVWAMLSFLILGFSLSAFLVDVAYLSKRIRIIVTRDMLIDAAYNPGCELDEQHLYMLLQIGSERPLKEHFLNSGQEKYRKKMLWNIGWILLPIYAVTPLFVFALWLLVYEGFF